MRWIVLIIEKDFKGNLWNCYRNPHELNAVMLESIVQGGNDNTSRQYAPNDNPSVRTVKSLIWWLWIRNVTDLWYFILFSLIHFACLHYGDNFKLHLNTHFTGLQIFWSKFLRYYNIPLHLEDAWPSLFYRFMFRPCSCSLLIQ